MRIIYLFHPIPSFAYLELWGAPVWHSLSGQGADSEDADLGTVTEKQSSQLWRGLAPATSKCDDVITVVFVAGDDLLGFSSAQLRSSH